MFKKAVLLFAAAVPVIACTTWIVTPEMNETGKMFLHKTRDWGGRKEVPVHFFFSQYEKSKYKVLANSHYQLLNEKGLAMMDTSAPKTTDMPEGKKKYTTIKEIMAEVVHNCANVEEALAVLENMTRNGSDPVSENYLLCDPHEAAVVEISPKNISVKKIKKGFTVHTNHHIHQEMLHLSKGSLKGNVKSATRMLIAQDWLARAIQDHGKVTMADSMALSRFSDEENYPDMAPFRGCTVCASDIMPDPENPALFSTIRICPGPMKYVPAIPIPMAIQEIPEVLKNGEMGKLAYKIKRGRPDNSEYISLFVQFEENAWKEYLAALEEGRKLLKEGKSDVYLKNIQSLVDRQVAEAYSLMEKVLAGQNAPKD